MEAAVIVDTDLDSAVVKVDQLGLNDSLVQLLRKNGVNHFFPSMYHVVPAMCPSPHVRIQRRPTHACTHKTCMQPPT